MKNENRIVRVRNKKLDRALNYVANLTGCTYQFAFQTFCDYIIDGHVWGDYSETKLVEMTLLSMRMDDE